MKGIVAELDVVLTMEEFLEYINHTIHRHLGLRVPLGLLTSVLGVLVPMQLSTTRCNALSILRSSVCIKLLGSSLHQQLNKKILAEVAECVVPLLTSDELSEGVKADLVNTLAQLHGNSTTELDEERPAKKMKRTKEDLKEMSKHKTDQILLNIRSKTPFCHIADVTKGVAKFLKSLGIVSSSTGGSLDDELDDFLVQRQKLGHHLLMLDGALDRLMADQLLDLRESEAFAGVAMATDESPPQQPRFRGLRFQIGVMYYGTFAPQALWESSSRPPITSTQILGDIMHCPGKKGIDVSKILEKQLARVGLSPFDVVSCTGDGGGENEGSSGVHAHFEHLNPGYVRRRCVPHIAWRTADMAIRASKLDYKNLASYFVEGITWSRLREIATRAPADGGLGLFADGSRPCQNLFGASPSAIIVSRPETDLNFLKLLRGKEHLLWRLASKDLEQRPNLGSETTRAVLNLGDLKQRIQRAILCEIIERVFSLLYENQKNHRKVAENTSWDQFMQRASGLILDLEITEEPLPRLGSSAEALDALDHRPRTWVEVVVLQVVNDEDLVGEHLGEALNFHRVVTDSCAGHLSLIADNTFRTPWQAAKLLSCESVAARSAAQELAKHLAQTRPANRSAFEKHMFDNETLWKELEEFSLADPPVLLWHGHGRFASLFKFLAPRFLLAPDHVLDCERIHAQWQWACRIKRSLKIQSLNALLKVSFQYLNNQAFPDHEDLWPHLQAERAQHRVDIQAIETAGVIAPGWR